MEYMRLIICAVERQEARGWALLGDGPVMGLIDPEHLGGLEGTIVLGANSKSTAWLLAAGKLPPKPPGTVLSPFLSSFLRLIRLVCASIHLPIL